MREILKEGGSAFGKGDRRNVRWGSPLVVSGDAGLCYIELSKRRVRALTTCGKDVLYGNDVSGLAF